jgi:hypothetical protein
MDPIRAMISRAMADFARDQIRPVAAALAMWTIAALLALVVVGFAIGGVYSAIEAPLGPIAASFIMAGIALLFVIVLVLMANRQISRLGNTTAPQPSEPPVEGLGSVAAAFAYGFAKGLGRRRRRSQ